MAKKKAKAVKATASEKLLEGILQTVERTGRIQGCKLTFASIVGEHGKIEEVMPRLLAWMNNAFVIEIRPLPARKERRR